MDDVNDADQEEDEGAASKGEEEEGLKPVPVSDAATTPLLPRNFSRGKRAGFRIRLKFLYFYTVISPVPVMRQCH